MAIIDWHCVLMGHSSVLLFYFFVTVIASFSLLFHILLNFLRAHTNLFIIYRLFLTLTVYLLYGLNKLQPRAIN